MGSELGVGRDREPSITVQNAIILTLWSFHNGRQNLPLLDPNTLSLNQKNTSFIRVGAE
ncbi:MAG: hypothetical protein BroJett040_11600 [Oligoflexia bacterium]|nr:MAG: hypothetical protein BroJett040_11600 [Oligoflexia bacterium]